MERLTRRQTFDLLAGWLKRHPAGRWGDFCDACEHYIPPDKQNWHAYLWAWKDEIGMRLYGYRDEVFYAMPGHALKTWRDNNQRIIGYEQGEDS